MSEVIKVRITHVFSVNDTMVVADTIEQAIATYRAHYTDGEVRKVEQMHQGIYSQDFDALISVTE